MSSEIPKEMLAKFPEMEAIGVALEEHRKGVPITARCLHCHELLIVEEVPAVGSLWIHCPCGKTTFRARRQPLNSSQS